MKRDVILVNTWRGAVLDEVALIRCLKERKIAGAGLDVFAQEPLDKNNPLKELDNAILTSHTTGTNAGMRYTFSGGRRFRQPYPSSRAKDPMESSPRKF